MHKHTGIDEITNNNQEHSYNSIKKNVELPAGVGEE
jgi:hypothetical protein